MKISLKWLSKFVELPIVQKFDKVVVGYVEDLKQHPNAEKLHVALVDVGTEKLQIVCGGVNLQKSQKVAVALNGAILPGNVKIKPTNLRGAMSNGMICAKEELRLGEGKKREIMILETTAKPGTPLHEALNFKGYSPTEIQNLFTIHTAEVEGIEYPEDKLKYVVTGRILEFEKITGSDKLHRATIDIGDKKIPLVFGSVHKIEVGWIVPIALPGAVMENGLEIKKTKFAGTDSEGMIADDKELGIPNTTEGLTIFPKNTPLGMPIADILGLRDIVLEIDNKSLTHRPDLWGHYGIAREMSAIFQAKLKPYEKAVKLAKDSDFTKEKILKIEIEKPEICPRYTACIMTEIKIAESPQWLKRDLIAVGVRPVNNVVDVTNHVMLGLGQPMHAFDRKIVGDYLSIEYAKEGEKLETLDHKIRTLSKEDVVVKNKKELLGIVGVMGGKNSEINNETTEIILQAENLNPKLIRRTSTRQMLRTDAVQRFEKGQDPKNTEIALRRACALLKQICPTAKIGSALTDIKNYEEKTVKVDVEIARVQKKIGAEIPATEMVKILKRLQFKAKRKGKFLEIEVPSFRATKDISMEDDITEEIARIYGYDKVPTELPDLPMKLPNENIPRTLKHQARDILSLGLGFTEGYNYSFYSNSDLQKALLPEEAHLQLKNFLSADQTHLRISLAPNILKNIQANLRFFNNFKVYEIGHIYQEIHEYFPNEEKWICAAVVTDTNDKNGFYQAKGALEHFLKAFGAKRYQTRETSRVHSTSAEQAKDLASPVLSEASLSTKGFMPPYAHPKKFLAYEFEEGKEFARVFELHPVVAKNFELEKAKINVFEVNLDALIAEGMQDRKYRPIPRFPGIEIDISVIIDAKKPVKEIEKLINVDPLIQHIELFDLYEGKNIETGKKAIAFKILLQAEDRTLTDEEMRTVQEKIFAELQKAGGVIRGL